MLSNSPFSPGVQVVAYLRDSGGEDQDLSVPQQESVITTWCLENGLILLNQYKDLAAPGSSAVGRAQFQAMVHWFRQEGCPAAGIVIWKYSRFARDIDDAQFYKADLRRRGFIIHSLNDTIPEGINGRFFEAAIDWMNQRFLEDLSTDIKRGLKHLVENYHAIPGTPPKGFKREALQLGSRRDGSPHTVSRWVPDPDTWELCRQAFVMRARNATYPQINGATHLFGSLNSYNDFFTNPIYHGELHYGDLVIQDAFPALVDEETWQAVQLLAARNAHHVRMTGPDNPGHPRRRQSHFLFSSIARCAKCNGLLNGHVIKTQNRPGHDYYACSTRQRRHACDAQQIPREILEKTVIEHLVDFLNHPQVILAQQEQQAQDHLQEASILAAERAEINRRLASLRRRMANITEAIEDKGKEAPHTLIDKLLILEAQETQLKTDLQKLKSDLSPVTHATAEQLTSLASKIQRMAAAEDKEPLRQILLAIVASLTVERDGPIVRGLLQIYLPPENEAAEAADPSGSTTSAVRKAKLMPISRCPCSEATHRHKFSIAFSRSIKG